MERHKLDLYLCLSDLSNLLKKNRFAITLAFFSAAALFFIISLFSTPQFHLEASFIEKHQNLKQLSQKSMLDTLSQMGSNEMGAATLFKSKRVLERAVMDTGIQMQIRPPFRLIELYFNLIDNAYTELAWIKNQYSKATDHRIASIAFKNVEYLKPFPKGISLVFLDDMHFEVWEHNQKLKTGSIDKRVSLADVHFTVVSQKQTPLKGAIFHITIQPLDNMVQFVKSRFTVEENKKDSTCLVLGFKYKDPLKGSELLNTIMEKYRALMKEDSLRIANEQLVFLEKRKSDNYRNFENIFSQFKKYNDKNVGEDGFLLIEDEVKMFYQPRKEMQRRLFVIENELKSLENTENKPHFQMFEGEFSKKMHNLQNDMDACRSRRETLLLAIGENSTHSKNRAHLEKELDQIKYEKQNEKESKQLLFQIVSNQPISRNLMILQNPSTTLASWIKKMYDNRDKDKTYLKTYLENRIRTSQLRQKILNERLNFSQETFPELQGIELETAGVLYTQYRKDLDSMQLKSKQLQYAISQLNEPSFEISTLGAILSDPISFSMISKAADLMLLLQDEKNHSLKEKARIQHELQIQRHAILLHTKDSLELHKLNEALIKDKLVSIQQITVELLNRKIAFLEDQLTQSLQTLKKNLVIEKQAVEKNLQDMSQKMRHLPEKWNTQEKLEFEKKLNMEILKTMTSFVESKNIAMYLDVIQSGPLDLATVPQRPKAPLIAVMSFAGGILGAFFIIAYLIFTAFFYGFPVSKDNLMLRGEYVAGKIQHNATATIKKSLLFLASKLKSNKVVHFIGSLELLKRTLKILQAQQQSVLVIHPFASKHSDHNHHYVGDQEALFSKEFKTKLEAFQKQYEWVIFHFDQQPTKIDPELFADLAFGYMICLKDENVEHLEPYFVLNNPKVFVLS
ncbi:MAG: hypothetical protein K940chlam8_00198 [Chlamydiae bacterium]|nr:hypothetical protein [Chlamydiota bacterium]